MERGGKAGRGGERGREGESERGREGERTFAERLFKSFYNQLLNSHDSKASHIAKKNIDTI